MKKVIVALIMVLGLLGTMASSPSNASLSSRESVVLYNPQWKGDTIAEQRIFLKLLEVVGNDTKIKSAEDNTEIELDSTENNTEIKLKSTKSKAKIKNAENNAKIRNLIGISYEHYLFAKRRYFKESRFSIINRPNLENFDRKGEKAVIAAFGDCTYKDVAAEVERLKLREKTMEELVAGLAATPTKGLTRSAHLLAIAETAYLDVNITKIHLIPQEALTATCLFHIYRERLHDLTDPQMRGIPGSVLETLPWCSANDLLNEEQRRGHQIFSPEQRRMLIWCMEAQGEVESSWGTLTIDYNLEYYFGHSSE